MLERYFDNAATTPVDPRVREAMLPFLGEDFGNANSIHAWGRRAADAVETARGQVARALGAEDPSQIVFTSGATEGNNWVLTSFAHGTVSPFEHSSVREAAAFLGFDVLPNEGLRLGTPREAGGFISVMAVNNEIGSRFDFGGVRQSAKVLHSDITQAAAKYAVDLGPLDYATLSAHKFYGPKGVGALYARDAPLPPMLHGGEHEHGQRSGTLNVPGIVGMGAAAAVAAERREIDAAHAARLGEIVLEEVRRVPHHRVNGGDDRAPHILSISFAGVLGEALVVEVDAAGYGISSGAACSSHSTEPSHVLRALRIPPEWMRGTIRISFGRFNTADAAYGLGAALRKAVTTLRSLS
ncbi:MAG TPA: cysteine desulfurase family protein [Fimbriimonadaceae bacterium]|nr:cysteine desulfurase family protein [Fimbriimonadaceae bacterium]